MIVQNLGFIILALIARNGCDYLIIEPRNLRWVRIIVINQSRIEIIGHSAENADGFPAVFNLRSRGNCVKSVRKNGLARVIIGGVVQAIRLRLCLLVAVGYISAEYINANILDIAKHHLIGLLRNADIRCNAQISNGFATVCCHCVADKGCLFAIGRKIIIINIIFTRMP